MNWISENKFLAGFIGFMVVGIGVLGFFLYQAIGNYAGVHQDYTARVQQLNQLQSLVPYRNQENLKKYEEQKTALAGVIDNLEKNVSAVQFPLDASTTPEIFQDRLRKSVDAVVASAKTNNVKLPDKFAMGFDRYLAEPPPREAAAPLDRELKAVEFVVSELVDARVESISTTTPLSRAPLPEESHAKPSASQVVKSALAISFVADQGKTRKVLNDLADTKKQFYIVRLIEIKSQNEKGLTRQEAQANRKDKSGNLRYVLGTEKLDVSLKLEIVNFNPPRK